MTVPHIAETVPQPEIDGRATTPPRLSVVPGRRPYPDAKVIEIRAQLDAKGHEADPLRVRMALQVFDRQKGAHVNWPGITWVVDVMLPAQAVEFREALEAFMREYVETRGGGGA